ncbi:MAG: hypothetical protein U9Q07_05420 [Planctomycetota bacterium]|nr:hypothetical protein [Planctomycetota bacterium]
MDFEFMKNWKSQATAVIGMLFVVFNQFYPNMLTPEQELEITKGLLGLFLLFYSLKKQRQVSGGAKQ